MGEPVNAALSDKGLQRVARCFAAKGRLQRWPSRRGDQLMVIWVVWWQLPDQQMSEVELNQLLRSWHDFEDYALIRRELVDLELMRRTPDGKIYRKIDRDMPQDAERLAALFG
jgi:Uncharacterized protein conserved in bacteria